jgi:hypothetical protein
MFSADAVANGCYTEVNIYDQNLSEFWTFQDYHPTVADTWESYSSSQLIGSRVTRGTYFWLVAVCPPSATGTITFDNGYIAAVVPQSTQ